MNYIKITTPSGKEFIVPEANNKEYYGRLNQSIKDEKQRYKIEPCVETKKQPVPADAGNGKGNPAADIDLTAKVADLLPLIKVFSDVEKLKQYIEKEKAADKPRETVIKAIQDRLEALEKE
jgi:hypothetical protein